MLRNNNILFRTIYSFHLPLHFFMSNQVIIRASWWGVGSTLYDGWALRGDCWSPLRVGRFATFRLCVYLSLHKQLWSEMGQNNSQQNIMFLIVMIHYCGLADARLSNCSLKGQVKHLRGVTLWAFRSDANIFICNWLSCLTNIHLCFEHGDWVQLLVSNYCLLDGWHVKQKMYCRGFAHQPIV